MHTISRIRWTDATIANVTHRRVHPEEVEAVCFSENPLIRSGSGGLHYVLGQIEGGRYLFVTVRKAANRGDLWRTHITASPRVPGESEATA